MNEIDDLDRLLASEELLTPSSGFAAAVMDSVREAAVEPAPLPFPWTRFAVGAIACGVSSAAGAVLLTTIDASTLATTSEAAAPLRSAAPEIGYAAAAVLASFVLLRVQRARSGSGARNFSG